MGYTLLLMTGIKKKGQRGGARPGAGRPPGIKSPRRPSPPRDTPPKTATSFRLDADIYQELLAEAERQGVHHSALVRAVVVEYIKKRIR